MSINIFSIGPRNLWTLQSFRPSGLGPGPQNCLPGLLSGLGSPSGDLAGRSFRPRRLSGDFTGRSFCPRRLSGDFTGRSFRPRRLSGDFTGRSFRTRRPAGDLSGRS